MANMKILFVFVTVAVTCTIVSACNNRPRDCQDLRNMGLTNTTVYTIFPETQTGGARVRCDMATDGGGWTFIQFRHSSSNFNLPWINYENGFGSPDTNHWLGNRLISKITSQDGYQLRVDMWKDSEYRYALYNHFQVFDVRSLYQTLINGYVSSSNATDDLALHNGGKFSTFDKDNDDDNANCASSYKGGWWYRACHRSNLNGVWGSTAYGQGLNWFGFTGLHSSLTRVEMKIRKWNIQVNNNPLIHIDV